ncbi:MAG: DUF4199 domain-containing protein [Pseudomonadota bacterium]
MLRYTFIYGAIIGMVVIAFMVAVLAVQGGDDVFSSELAGYAVMLAVLSLVFVGIKRFRDIEYGGVITFVQGAGVGIGISAVAGLFYAIGWEFFLYATDFAFIETYSNSLRAEIDEQALSSSERAAKLAEIDAGAAMYRNPLIRLPITFIEIFPVGVAVALVSALILRNSKVLPAKARS